MLVQGSLLATLLIDLFRTKTSPFANIIEFNFKALHPIYVNEEIILKGCNNGDLWIEKDGQLCMTAKLTTNKNTIGE